MRTKTIAIQNDAENGADGEGALNAMIIYDDFASATRAKAMLERAARSAEASAEWRVNPWRLDMLLLPATAETALADAAEAHLIVLALGEPRFFPVWLPNWLEQWAARRLVQEAALAVWDGGGSAHSSTGTPGLPQFARRHGLSMIFHDSASAENKPPVEADGLSGRAASMPPVLRHVPGPPPDTGHQRCRING